MPDMFIFVHARKVIFVKQQTLKKNGGQTKLQVII